MNTVSIKRVFDKYTREISKSNLDEDDVITWTGEALSFMPDRRFLVQKLYLKSFTDYQLELPNFMHSILMVAVKNPDTDFSGQITASINSATEQIQSLKSTDNTPRQYFISLANFPQTGFPNIIYVDQTAGKEYKWDTTSSTYIIYPIIEGTGTDGNFIQEALYTKFNPDYWIYMYDYQQFLENYINKNIYIPVRSNTNDLFGICDTNDQYSYRKNWFTKYEYKMINKCIRFNFPKGDIALSYLSAPTDLEGYPEVPDHITCLNAIIYYCGWKLSERGEKMPAPLQYYEQRWLKYLNQFKQYCKQFLTIDEHQDFTMRHNYLMPRQNEYVNFFNNLGNGENRWWNDPSQRNRFLSSSGRTGISGQYGNISDTNTNDYY
jgi:hypothetical protein